MFQIIGRRAPNNIQASLRSRIQRSKRSSHVAAAAALNSCAFVGGPPERSNDATSYSDPGTHRYFVASADSLAEASSNMAAIRKRIADMQLSGNGAEDDDGG